MTDTNGLERLIEGLVKAWDDHDMDAVGVPTDVVVAVSALRKASWGFRAEPNDSSSERSACPFDCGFECDRESDMNNHFLTCELAD